MQSENQPHHNLYQPREIKFFNDSNLIVSGITQSGKTSFVFHSLQFIDENYLYIDFDDGIFYINKLIEIIQNSSLTNKTLVIDIYNLNIYDYMYKILEIIKKANAKRLIIISWLPIKLENFQNIYIYPLNFEEFLSFHNSIDNIDNLDGLFVKYSQIGGFPIFAKYSDQNLTKHLKRLLKCSITDFDIDLLRDIADNVGVPRSIFNIYESIKKRRAVSKDKLYKKLSELIEQGYIFSIVEYQKSSIFKYFLIDQTLQSIFESKKDFSRLFELMVVSELRKRDLSGFFYRNIEIYISETKTAILPFPFAESSIFEKIIKRTLRNLKTLGAEKLQIITMNFEETYSYKSKNSPEILFEAIKFTRWALTL